MCLFSRLGNDTPLCGIKTVKNPQPLITSKKLGKIIDCILIITSILALFKVGVLSTIPTWIPVTVLIIDGLPLIEHMCKRAKKSYIDLHTHFCS